MKKKTRIWELEKRDALIAIRHTHIDICGSLPSTIDPNGDKFSLVVFM